MLERIICILIGYVFGLLQTGYLYGKMKHVDIRNFGSGNAGATNTLRTLGVKAALITFLGDCFKTVFAVLIVTFIFKDNSQSQTIAYGFYAGLGAVFGHNFPFYLKFKGGKGIASTAGLLLVSSIITGNWLLLLIGFLAFAIPVTVTRYVSLGSLILVTIYLLEIILFGYNNLLGLKGSHLTEVVVLVTILTISAFYKHRGNIVKLMNGTENKLGKKVQ